MSLHFTPLNGATIAFGNVIVNTSSPSVISANSTGNLSVQDTVISIAFSGANAANFSFSPSVSGYVKIYSAGDNGSGSIIFTPNSVASFSATATITFQDNSNQSPGGAIQTLSYSLTGAGIANPSPPPATEVTSLLQSFRELLVPSQGTTGKVLSYYDTASLNDVTDSATYTFKAEDIIADRVPTTRRVLVTYIDLGVATLQVNVSAINDNGALVTQTVSITIGTVAAAGEIATAFADLAVTGYRPQVSFTRAANAGPVFISHVVVSGTIEKGGSL